MNEHEIGMRTGHAEVHALVEDLLSRAERSRRVSTASRSRARS
jgi:hypothetical protein